MKIKNNVIFLIFLSLFQSNVFANLFSEGILQESGNSKNSCFLYQPNLGSVEDIDNLDIKSDQFEITDEKVLILNGNTEIDFPNGFIYAGKARIDKSNGSVEFKKNGDIYLKDFFFRANEGIFNKDTKYIGLVNGEAYINDRGLLLSFEDLNGSLDSEVTLNKVSMTTCQSPSKGWLLEADTIYLDAKTNRGKAKKVNIKIFDKTFLKLPVVPFATSDERMTGFLEPSLSYSSDGIDFMIPYYKVLSDESDITAAARNISERGVGIEGNYRRLHSSKKNLTNIDFLYFGSDKEYKRLSQKSSESRWAFSLKDRYQVNNNIKIDVDWSKVSDSLVLRDISGEITAVGSQRQQYLSQNVSVSGTYDNITFKIEQEKNQSLNPLLTNGYKKSPSIDLRFSKKIGKFSFHENLNITYFKADALHGFFGNGSVNKYLINVNKVNEGSRIYSDFKIVNNTYLSKINISSSIGVKSIKYDLNDGVETKNINVPNFKLDLSSTFIKKKNMHIHLIKPSLIYGFVDYKDQDINPVFDTNTISMNNTLFSNERFAGKDRIGDQHFYSINLEYKKRHMGMDMASLSVSKQFFIKDRKVWIDSSMMNMPMNMMDMNMPTNMMDMNMPMNMMDMPMDEGPIIVMGKWMPSMKTMLMTYGGYFEETKKMPMGGLTLKHKFDKGSFGYAKRYRRMSGDFNVVLDYSEFSTDLMINENYSLIAKFKRDDENGSKIESAFGVGYENCCFKFSITASDKNLSKYLLDQDLNSYTYLNEAWDNIIRIEDKSRVNFQFQLKGLNSSINKVGRLFNNSIFDY